ncbi:RNA polymerase sigma-70 factor [Pedobacter sp. HMWF019]|uniref:RNA polymerase sigma factor n=1 Tax=Pedobacter sp. HMWF019 TaxID=2056856 RepID=UPI000D3AFE94|nr:sigma-70 family RNA polymerase sigma factor [Pedobacter sp. HMWF019]PTS92901.1 RNA polymerase sigma-70 factor [Pedobacter sp. HMWF019]
MRNQKSDKELLEDIGKGYETAFQYLFDRHWNTLYTFVYRLIKDEDQTKDILQNIFLEIWNKKEILLIEESILPYLYKIAKNDVMSLFRRNRVRLDGHEVLIRNLKKSSAADDGIIVRQLQEVIDLELAKMPLNMRQCFQLSKYEHKSIREIALELMLSEQTVKNNISEALKRLRFCLNNESLGYMSMLITILLNLSLN